MSDDMDEEEFVKRLHVAFEREAERHPDERERIFRGEKEELVRLVAQEYKMHLEYGGAENAASKDSENPLEIFLEQSREIFDPVDSNEISEEAEEISEEIVLEDFTDELELSSEEEESDEEYKKKKAQKERKKQEAYRKANEERAERQRKEFREQQEFRQREEEKLQEADRQRREQQILYERQMEEQRQLQERQRAEGKAQLEAQQKNYEKQQEELRQKDSFKQGKVPASTVPSNGAQTFEQNPGSDQGTVSMTGSGETNSGAEEIPQRDLYREKYSSEAIHKKYQEEDRLQAELDKQADLKKQQQEAVVRQIEKEKSYATYESVNQDGHFNMEEARQAIDGTTQNETDRPTQIQDASIHQDSQTNQNSPNHLSQTFPNTNHSSTINSYQQDFSSEKQEKTEGAIPPLQSNGTEPKFGNGVHDSYPEIEVQNPAISSETRVGIHGKTTYESSNRTEAENPSIKPGAKEEANKGVAEFSQGKESQQSFREVQNGSSVNEIPDGGVIHKGVTYYESPKGTDPSVRSETGVGIHGKTTYESSNRTEAENPSIKPGNGKEINKGSYQLFEKASTGSSMDEIPSDGIKKERIPNFPKGAEVENPSIKKKSEKNINKEIDDSSQQKDAHKDSEITRHKEAIESVQKTGSGNSYQNKKPKQPLITSQDGEISGAEHKVGNGNLQGDFPHNGSKSPVPPDGETTGSRFHRRGRMPIVPTGRVSEKTGRRCPVCGENPCICQKRGGGKSKENDSDSEFCLICGKKKSLCTCKKKVCPICKKSPCVCKKTPEGNRSIPDNNTKKRSKSKSRERFYDFRENAHRATQSVKRFSRRVGFTTAANGLSEAFQKYISRTFYSGDDTADALNAKDEVMEKGRIARYTLAVFAPGQKGVAIRGLVKANNADELIRLRKFRDDQMSMNPSGKRQIKRAYRQQKKKLNQSGTKIFTRTLKSQKELETFRKELGLEHLTDQQIQLRMERITGKGIGKLLRKGNLTPEQLAKLADLRSELILRKYERTIGSRLLHARALVSALGGIIISSARKCEDAGMQGALRVWNLSRNKYARKIGSVVGGNSFELAKWITRNTLGRALKFTGGLAKAAGRAALNTKVGQAGVQAAKAGAKAARAGAHAAKKEVVNFAKRKIQTAANTKVGHFVGKGIKTGAKGAKIAAKGAGAVGRGVGFVGHKVGKVYQVVAKPFQLVGKAMDAFQIMMKKLVFVASGFLIFFVILAMILNICGGAVSFIFGDETDDGKIDLAPYVKILDEANKDFTKRLDNALSNNGGKYDNVTVSYIGAENGDNYKEILSMMAVRMGQEFTKEHTKKEVEEGKCDNVGLSWTLKEECKGHMDETEKYLKFMYQKSHTITSVPSAFYQCSTKDCQTKKVTVVEKDENGNTTTKTTEEPYCPGKHQDLVVTVQVLKFDELFGIDYYGGGSSGMAAASQRLVQVALGEVGNTDGSKYWEFTVGSSFENGDTTPWCAAFISWCAEQCGYIEDGLFPKSASSATYRTFFSSKGLYKTPGEYTPKAGDILIETNDAHAAIVKSVEDGKVHVINGNWNDKVAESSYPLDSPKIAGYCTPEYPMGEMLEIPAGMGTTHTYMAWQLCTAIGTPQNNLLQMEGKFDEEGFGRIDGRYVIACTTTFGNVGDYVDFYRADGSVLQTVIGDIKNQNDPGCNMWGHLNGQAVVEFIVDENTWYHPYHENPGTASCHPEWGSSNPIVSAVKLGINYFGDAGSSKPGNSNGVMKPQASEDWDGWTEDNIEWAKNIYGLEDAEWKETYSGFEGNGSIITGGGDNVITGTGQFSHPCPGMTYQSSYFGEIREFETGGHKGHDYAAPEGTPTYAAADGTVIIAGWSDSAGNWVVIDHGNGLVSKYMHHSAIFVKAGQTVKKGDHIGAVGSTGQSTGPHLHFQVEENGIPVNPDKYLNSK